MIGATKDISGAIKPPDGTSLTQFPRTRWLTVPERLRSTIPWAQRSFISVLTRSVVPVSLVSLSRKYVPDRRFRVY